MDQQTIRDGISGQQIILQQPSAGGAGINSHPTIVTTTGNYLTSSAGGVKRQRLGLASQAADLVETHHLVVTGDNEPVKLDASYNIRSCSIKILEFHRQRN